MSTIFHDAPAFIQARPRQVEQRQVHEVKRYGFMVKKEMAGTRYAEFEWPVERDKIREFASAKMDPYPVYRDRDYAKKKGFDDVLIPVTFPMSFVEVEIKFFDHEDKTRRTYSESSYRERQMN